MTKQQFCENVIPLLHSPKSMALRILIGVGILGLVVANGTMQGPAFVKEPPDYVDFSNMTGVTIECAASGHPTPQVTWVMESGDPVTNLPEVRQVLPGGELVFPAFKAEYFRQDVHAAIYRCLASNAAGTILSRVVHVRAVVPQSYEIQVFDVHAIVQTTAVLKCHVPSFLEEHVRVTMWLRDEVLIIEPNGIMDGKYAVLPTGELHIREVTMDDTGSSYRCHVKHRLTGETHFSSASGRLYVTDPQGTVPPRITDIRPAVHVSEGATVILPCVAQGHPAPKAEWFAKLNKRQLFPLHMGERVQQTSGALIIHRAQTSDSGTYVCDVSNEAGSERGETTVTVTAPLSVSVSPEKQVVDIGKTATFRCIVSGFPVTTVTWYKDGKKVPTEGGGRTTSEEVIHIESIHVTDKGMYQCIVNNALESAQGAGQLILGDAAPQFMGVFEDETFQPGSDASLKCVAIGSPAPRISWSLDGQDLKASSRLVMEETTDEEDGSVASQLNVTQAQWEDGGAYRCTATNKAGQTEHAARLNIFGRPAIRNMGRVTTIAGDDIRLNCPYYGYPIDAITWEKDGRPMPYNLRQVVFPNGTVLIRKVQRASDTGKYSCAVSNSQGQNAQEHIDLAVMVAPKIVPFSFQSDHLFEGVLARISCVVYQGDLPLKIQWSKDGLALAPDLGATVREIDDYSSILTIDSVERRHSGNYSCVAQNSASTVNYTAELVVNVPPRWKIEPGDVSVLLGHQLLIDCLADGFPKPKVTWVRTRGATVGEHVDPVESRADMRILANGSLYIEDAHESHRGHYFCKASNGIGDGLSTAVLLGVLVPPRFDVKFRNQTLMRSEGFRLECPPAGDTPMTFSWRKDGVALDPQLDTRYQTESLKENSVSVLTVEEASRVDSGIYTCAAKNSYGSDEATMQITVFEPPDSPGDIRVRDIRSRSAEVTWSAPFDGHGRISKYVIEYSKDEFQDALADMAVSGWNTSATLHGMTPATHYHLRVFAENEFGLSIASDIFKFVTTEEAPAGPPLDVEADAVDANTVIVRWKPPKPELWMGKLRGFYVGYKLLDSAPPYTFQVVKIGEDVQENYTSNVSELKKYTKYSVIVAAYTDQGRGPPSEEVLVMTAEDVPGQPPMDVRCTPLTSQSIHVTWQPPPPHTLNGILRGYKVLYVKAEEVLDDAPLDHKSTTVVRTTLHGLEKYTNYSIRVVAFTKVGDGAASSPIHCRSLDDVPDVPADVKAVPASKESVLVAWKSPLHSNGVVTKYHVYAKHVDDAEEDAIKHTVPPTALYYELPGLKTNQPYEFWVTAATLIGESPRSKMVSEAPQGPIVPARIAAFSGVITTLWKKYIKLPCKAVGNPVPERVWTLGAQVVKESDRLRILPDGTLMVKNVQWSDSGNYSCRVKNGFGQDHVTYCVNVLAPPSAPAITVSETSATAIVLEWKLETDGGTNVQGYTLNYKREFSHWEQIDLAPDSSSYSLSGLKCGSQYQMYMTAFNKIGTGSPSEVISVGTNGTIPEIPDKDVLIDADIGSITLNLQSWNREECPIFNFMIEYRPKSSSVVAWHLLADELKGEQENFVIRELQPGTPYDLRITAHNGAGSAVATYDFMTLSRQGDTVSPHNRVPEETRGVLFYLDLRIIIPVAVLVFVVVLILSVMCLCANRRDNAARKMKGVDGHAAHNGPSHPGLRTDSAVNGFSYTQRHRSSTDGSILRPDLSQEKPLPYATYHLPNLRSSAEFKTFGPQPRNNITDPSSPANNLKQQEVADSDANNTYALQNFSRSPQGVNGQGYPSPNGKRTVHPVAIPTAPPMAETTPTSNNTDPPTSPALRRLPEVPPKPNMGTMETRFSPSPTDKVKCRVMVGPQSGVEQHQNIIPVTSTPDWSSSPDKPGVVRSTFSDGSDHSPLR